MSTPPPEFIDWARKWIEAHNHKWCDPWGRDLHHDLAAELIRQMEWAWLTGNLQGADETMSCGYSRERILRDWNERLGYPHVAADPWKGADIHLAPDGWTPEGKDATSNQATE